MSDFLNFLDNIEIEEAVVEKSTKRTKKDRNPDKDSMRLRLFKDGSVYPSEALVAKFNLEFQPVDIVKEGNKVLKTKRDQTVEENGFDIVNSNHWMQYPQDQEGVLPLILISPASKSTPKVDLFGSTKYTDEGEPKSDVMSQGAPTYGKNELLPMLVEVYSRSINEDMDYIDLDVIIERDLGTLSKNGVFYIPKTVSRGDKKGDISYVRRENINLYPLVPVVNLVETVENQLPNEGELVKEEEELD